MKRLIFNHIRQCKRHTGSQNIGQQEPSPRQRIFEHKHHLVAQQHKCQQPHKHQQYRQNRIERHLRNAIEHQFQTRIVYQIVQLPIHQHKHDNRCQMRQHKRHTHFSRPPMKHRQLDTRIKRKCRHAAQCAQQRQMSQRRHYARRIINRRKQFGGKHTRRHTKHNATQRDTHQYRQRQKIVAQRPKRSAKQTIESIKQPQKQQKSQHITHHRHRSQRRLVGSILVVRQRKQITTIGGKHSQSIVGTAGHQRHRIVQRKIIGKIAADKATIVQIIAILDQNKRQKRIIIDATRLDHTIRIIGIAKVGAIGRQFIRHQIANIQTIVAPKNRLFTLVHIINNVGRAHFERPLRRPTPRTHIAGQQTQHRIGMLFFVQQCFLKLIDRHLPRVRHPIQHIEHHARHQTQHKRCNDYPKMFFSMSHNQLCFNKLSS